MNQRLLSTRSTYLYKKVEFYEPTFVAHKVDIFI
jgi:hypothetical protein